MQVNFQLFRIITHKTLKINNLQKAKFSFKNLTKCKQLIFNKLLKFAIVSFVLLKNSLPPLHSISIAPLCFTVCKELIRSNSLFN